MEGAMQQAAQAGRQIMMNNTPWLGIYAGQLIH